MSGMTSPAFLWGVGAGLPCSGSAPGSARVTFHPGVRNLAEAQHLLTVLSRVARLLGTATVGQGWASERSVAPTTYGPLTRASP
jgi:hypothetical protein